MKGHFNKLFRNIAAKKGKNEFDKRLIKATYGHDSKEPKEKHVQFLFNWMHGGSLDATPKHVLSSLSQRGMDNLSNWAVNMKVLIIFHKLLKDKKLAMPVALEIKNCCLAFHAYEKSGSKLKTSERIIQVLSKMYWEYLQLLVDFLNESKFSFIPRTKEEVDKLFKELDSQEVLNHLSKFHAMIEKITAQLENRDFCNKSRLYSEYAKWIFDDCASIYFWATQLIKAKFSSLSSKKKASATEHYEFFLNFGGDFKALERTVPTLFNMEYKSPEICELKPETLRKLKKSTKLRSNTFFEAPPNFAEEDKQEKSEEYNFDDLADEPIQARTQSVVFAKANRLKPAKQAKISVDEFTTNALDNLLLDEGKQKRHHTMAPKQIVSKEAEWDPFAGKFQENDNVFDKAADASDDDDPLPNDIDDLLFEPKISLSSSQSNSMSNGHGSNKLENMGRLSDPSKGLAQFNTGMNGLAMNADNQFRPMGYGGYASSSYNRFSAPSNPGLNHFNY